MLNFTHKGIGPPVTDVKITAILDGWQKNPEEIFNKQNKNACMKNLF